MGRELSVEALLFRVFEEDVDPKGKPSSARRAPRV